MKRLSIRLTVLSVVVVVLGLIAIAQARYGRNAPSEQSADAIAGTAAVTPNSSGPAAETPALQDQATVATPVPSGPTARAYEEPSPGRLAAPGPPAVAFDGGAQNEGLRDRGPRYPNYGVPRPRRLGPEDRTGPEMLDLATSDREMPAATRPASADDPSLPADPAPADGGRPVTSVPRTVGVSGTADRYGRERQVADHAEPPALLRKTVRQEAAAPSTDDVLQPLRPGDERAGSGGFAATPAAPVRIADEDTRQPLEAGPAAPADNPLVTAAAVPMVTEAGGRRDSVAGEPGRFDADGSASPLDAGGARQPRSQPRPDGVTEGRGLPAAVDLEGTQAPSLTLRKIAPDEIQVGKECTFEIKIANVGQVAAHGVIVRDEIPQKTRLVATRPRAHPSADGQLFWEIGTLAAGDEASLEMRLLPIAEGEVGSVATVQFEAQASIRTVATKPELALRLTGPRTVMIGDEVPVRIEVSNSGSGAASGIILLEDVPPGMSHPAGQKLEFEIGTLAPGESRELELVLTAEQAGRITNQLTARGDANLSVEANVDVEVVAPQLQVSIDGPKRRYLERQATYTLSVDNPGTAAAKDIQLAAYLPKGMKFVRADNHGHYDPATHTVVWGLDELPAKEHGNVKLVAIPVEAGKQTLRAEGTAAQGLDDEVKQDIAVEGLAAIMFEVVDLEDPIEVGGDTTYEIRVVNQGSKTATEVQVLVQVPPDMKPLSASGPTQYAIEADRVVFAPLHRLAPKGDTTFRLKVQGLAPGDQRLRVQLVTNEFRAPVTEEESTRVYADE